jgi:hypothetical protein
LDQADRAGAESVIFTGTYASQVLPAPSAAIHRIASSRTTKRDMNGELADACHMRGPPSILYYNHSCDSGDDPTWERSVCFRIVDKSRLVENQLANLGEFSARYDFRLDDWRFDSCFSLDPRDVYNIVPGKCAAQN